MTFTTNENEAIHSTLGGDPELGELVEMFVAEMPDRISTLERAIAAGNLDALRCAAHQMKGAAGSYGFGQLTPLAAAVENSVRSQQPEETIRQTLQELLGLCRQVRAGTPDGNSLECP